MPPQAREAAKRAKRKAEEKNKWWRGAELFRELPDDEDQDPGGPEAAAGSTDSTEAAKAALLRRYSNDYSRWEAPVVDDPASKAEAEESRAAAEAKENAEFEARNPDFCNDFISDQKKRTERARAVAESANVLRLKGNRFFKAKRYGEALERYMASLKEKPYDVSTLNNVAMAHLKLGDLPEGLEFADRAIYLDPSAAKARSRRATALHGLGRLDEVLTRPLYQCRSAHRALHAHLNISVGAGPLHAPVLAHPRYLYFNSPAFSTPRQMTRSLLRLQSKFELTWHSAMLLPPSFLATHMLVTGGARGQCCTRGSEGCSQEGRRGGASGEGNTGGQSVPTPTRRAVRRTGEGRGSSATRLSLSPLLHCDQR